MICKACAQASSIHCLLDPYVEEFDSGKWQSQQSTPVKNSSPERKRMGAITLEAIQVSTVITDA